MLATHPSVMRTKQEQKMKCPKDGADLVSDEKDAHILKCSTCAGILIFSESILRFVQGSGVDLMKLSPNRAQSISCPGCQREMGSWIINEVEVDTCEACRLTWFDQGEFEKHTQELSSESKEKLMSFHFSKDDFGILQALLKLR